MTELTKKLVLHIELPAVNVEDIPREILGLFGDDTPSSAQLADVVICDVWHPRVAVVTVDAEEGDPIPWEGRIVGAEVVDRMSERLLSVDDGVEGYRLAEVIARDAKVREIVESDPPVAIQPHGFFGPMPFGSYERIAALYPEAGK